MNFNSATPQQNQLKFQADTPIAGSTELTDSRLLRLASYIVAGHALLLLGIVTLYYTWELLSDYRVPILWAVITSMALRGICDALVDFWNRELQQRSLAGCGMVFLFSVENFLGLEEQYRWFKQLPGVQFIISRGGEVIGYDFNPPASPSSTNQRRDRSNSRCIAPELNSSGPYFRTVALLIFVWSFWEIIITLTIISTAVSGLWFIWHNYLLVKIRAMLAGYRQRRQERSISGPSTSDVEPSTIDATPSAKVGTGSRARRRKKAKAKGSEGVLQVAESAGAQPVDDCSLPPTPATPAAASPDARHKRSRIHSVVKMMRVKQKTVHFLTSKAASADKGCRNALLGMLRSLVAVTMIFTLMTAFTLAMFWFTFSIVGETRRMLAAMDSLVQVVGDAYDDTGAVMNSTVAIGKQAVLEAAESYLPQAMEMSGTYVAELEGTLRRNNMTEMADMTHRVYPHIQEYLQSILKNEPASEEGNTPLELIAVELQKHAHFSDVQGILTGVRRVCELFVRLQWMEAGQELLLLWTNHVTPLLPSSEAAAQTAEDGSVLTPFQSIRQVAKDILDGVALVIGHSSQAFSAVLSWGIVKSLYLLSMSFSVLMGISAEVMRGLVFFTVLYYLLAAEHDIAENVVGLLPLSRENQNKVVVALSNAVRGVIESAIKLAVFHVMLTWLVFNVFGVTSLLYTSMLFSAATAILPFPPVYVVTLPAALHLATQGHMWMGLLMVGVYYFVSSYAFYAIYEEIPGSMHPYITGLSVFGGMSLFKPAIQGAIMGPLLLAGLSVGFNLQREFMGSSINVRRSSSFRPLHRVYQTPTKRD
ncbi:hypothetical protein CYMTET_8353 [Cymbomonas tetramitiformis]|uniref:Transmembrane protein n=1 Tax=Cymbomonas tetramitiformis TaxID=36881 RepID=A0AAE0GTS8_9CHLO|nr:hypothetical protein CYMTET_8353 [Cymbomonas tetramitiformis]